MTESIAGLLRWMQNSAWAVGIRQSLWLYPAIEIVHILGIVLVAGGAIFFDLRLLGVSGKLAVGNLKYLLSWSKKGLLIAIPSGILLFITNAETLGYDPVFHTKLILLALAGLNALLFHTLVFGALQNDGHSRGWLRSGKLNAVCSIIIWITIIACGRLLAY
jgi:hypothetical protein